MWFTSSDGGSIGRLGPDGTVEQHVDDGIVQPEVIVVGGDGCLWFTDAEARTVGRLDPIDGSLEFACRGIDLPNGLARGRAGEMWAAYSHSLRRITVRDRPSATGGVARPDDGT